MNVCLETEWDEAAYHEPEYFELTPSNVVLNNNGTLFAHILCDGPHGKVHRRHGNVNISRQLFIKFHF